MVMMITVITIMMIGRRDVNCINLLESGMFHLRLISSKKRKTLRMMLYVFIGSVPVKGGVPVSSSNIRTPSDL